MNREQERLKYRTLTKDGYPTFDLEMYYNDMPTEKLIELRDKTIASLQRYPDFGTQFYTDFVAYLNGKIYERTN